MLAGARAREGSRHANNVAIARLELLGQVDLVAGRVLNEHVQIRNLLANADEGARRGVEAANSSRGAGEGNAAERCAE